ncbi:MAG TPA: HlyD family efflux transporter periplasmic adaptor subunit [Gemmatimonadales bacterium]|nr:HlyD family efflux transporter periplasmic adaptor subunit [Gemmatimonadales bacterium]
MSPGRSFPLLFLLGAGCAKSAPDSYDARGTVEVPEVNLGAMTSARVIAIRVDEGARVAAGDTIALLTQVELGATLAAQAARVTGASANLRDLEAGARPEEVHRAEAEVAAATAELERATKELVRMRDLASRDVVSRQTLDNAVTAERVARARLSSAEEALRLVKAGTRPEQVAAGRAEVASARAALAQIEARAADLVLVSPVAGVVLSRNAEPGEGLGPNVPVVTIGETGRPYVRVFVPQSRVTSLAVGSAAQVVTEDGRTMAGRVVAINPKAEFTPRVALSEQERADLMFGVKVEFATPAEAPHPGLWVTVRLDAKAPRR